MPTARTLTMEANEKEGQKITLKGWVNSIRSHGQIIFIDLRDRAGIIQLVIAKDENDTAFKEAKKVGEEYVIEVTGKVKARDKGFENNDLPTGKIEVQVVKITVLAKSRPTPFPINTDGANIDELLRLKYRYLDIRRPRLLKTLQFRGDLYHETVDFLSDEGFTYIETPILTKSTPEGARDFVVPSRLQPGKFYALPQSPQQYKQLLMIGGIEKYFQMPRCFRDEDPRADRVLEFTQIDIEMSFPTQEEILELGERLIKHLFEKTVKKHYPEKKLVLLDKKGSFQRIAYKDALQKYKTDRPDLRKGTEFEDDPNAVCFEWVVDFPMFEYKEGDKRWGAAHHPFTMMQEEDIGKFKAKKYEDVKASQYDLVGNGFEVGGGSIRNTDPELLAQVFQALGHTREEIQQKFGHLLEAFEYGVPPHGGIASGFDRLCAVLSGETNIREVIAFPPTQMGQLSVMEGPSELEPEQLEELGLKPTRPKRKR